MQIGKEKVKVSLFVGDVIVYMNDPTNSTGKLLQLIHTSNKAAEYKINSQKALALLLFCIKYSGYTLRNCYPYWHLPTPQPPTVARLHRQQPGGNSVPSGPGSNKATKGNFIKTSIPL